MTKTIAIIPAYNEAKHISKVISLTKKYVDQVIVIDDGSNDSTYHAAKETDILAKHITNLGKGAALRTGFELALLNKADVIITIDADGQNDPAEIPLLLKTMIKHNADIVVGARRLDSKMPAIFRIGNFWLTKLFQILFHLKIYDTQSGFRAFKANIYPKIKWQSNGYGVETEMLANAGKNKLKCVNISITTKYLDSYKGTTIIDGINIFIQMLLWKIRR